MAYLRTIVRASRNYEDSAWASYDGVQAPSGEQYPRLGSRGPLQQAYFKMRRTTDGVLLLIPHVSVVPSTVEGDENTGIISGIPVADVIMV